METLKLPVAGEKYYHFKHNTTLDSVNYSYVIIGIAKHTETREELVVYKPLYPCEVELFVRPLEMFLEIVDKPEYKYRGPRFRLVKAVVEFSESQKITLDSYNKNAQKYADLTKPIAQNQNAKDWLDFLSTIINKEFPVLEIGSGSGVCSDYLELLGFKVDRTYAVESFIDYQKNLGKGIEFLNILNNTASQKNNFILANAVLHHFTSDELQVVLNNIKESLSINGLLAFSVNVGTGEEFTNQKIDAPRYYKYWTQESLKPILSNSGFEIVNSQEIGRWLRIVAQKNIV
jgi:hypothetical protein